MTEIEIKAHVTDPDITEQTIRSLAEFSRESRKRDVYWVCNSGSPVKIRIREENDCITVTYKRKEIRDSIEINDEQEFAVSDRRAFETLITDLGFSISSEKEKITRSFCYKTGDGPTVTIELSLVAGLGWFIELEILAESPGEQEISRDRNILRELLGRCGIPREAIEPRFYTEMLGEVSGS
ncbi:class IV adenylate cyclase [Brucepastera parasyntrophica]|uniref:class IV adenylate cyclase n=1 Tax=Brucepastera parasyntrophica TaxID=2880008 RepID=UPI00210A7E44|nr:class IV adenylate cyclase [Brucepastera parasyntrophica]ULQ60615.1 class IV adenylate cyclase [Brucepastera parasyntrophica]